MDTTVNPETGPDSPGTSHEEPRQPGHDRQPLTRPYHGRMAAGVCAGVASYAGVDVTIVRIAFAVLAVAGGGAGIPLYIAAWLLIPEEGASESVASHLFRTHQAQ